MNWRKKLNLLFTFYLNFLVPSVLISLICAYVLFSGGYKFIPMVAWFKVITLALMVLYVNLYKKKDFFYFYNLGLSKIFLWTSTLAFDMVLYILLLTLTGIK